MVRAGRHDIGVYLDLADGLANDKTAVVTDTLATRLAFIGEYLVTRDQQPRWQRWIRERFGPSLEGLGVPGDPRDTDERQSRRAELLGLVAGTGNDPALQRRIGELADTYLSNAASLSGTLAPVVLRLAAASGDAALIRSVSRPARYARRPARGVLPLLQCAVLVYPAGAGAANSGVRHLTGRPHAGHGDAARGVDVAAGVARRRVGFRASAVARAHAEARHVPRHSDDRRIARRILLDGTSGGSTTVLRQECHSVCRAHVAASIGTYRELHGIARPAIAGVRLVAAGVPVTAHLNRTGFDVERTLQRARVRGG